MKTNKDDIIKIRAWFHAGMQEIVLVYAILV
jgi:hypothetical protein